MAGIRIQDKYRIGFLLSAGILMGAAAGCNPPLQVSTQWGPGLRFSEKTSSFDWKAEGRRTTGEGRPKNPKGDALIRAAVEKELTRKGYRKVSDSKPDFWVDYLVARQVRGDPYGDAYFSQFTEGSLAVYATNPEDGKLIWKGCVDARLDDSASPQTQVERLDAAVRVLLNSIPDHKAAGR
jgi:hypothetical protein